MLSIPEPIDHTLLNSALSKMKTSYPCSLESSWLGTSVVVRSKFRATKKKTTIPNEVCGGGRLHS